jgi:hypothetical protein
MIGMKEAVEVGGGLFKIVTRVEGDLYAFALPLLVHLVNEMSDKGHVASFARELLSKIRVSLT